MAEVVEALVDGGKASAGPPLGPALGPMGVNIGKIVEEINKKTKDFAGMKVPVKVIIEKDKSFSVTVGTPPMSALILKEMGIDKGEGDRKNESPPDMTIEQAKKVARMKGDSLYAKDVKAGVLTVCGTCVSMGFFVDGKPAKQTIKLIKNGDYDADLTSSE